MDLSISLPNDADEDQDLYSSDDFRMFEFKVRPCVRGRSHDWTDCPFAHPGERARRRDLRRHRYSGTICPDFRRTGGRCPHGDECGFAHGVFECWLHPDRYRTTPCKDGRKCRRKVCFFAHTPRQLRRRPSSSSPTSTLTGVSSPPRGGTSEKGKGVSYEEVFGELVGRLKALDVFSPVMTGPSSGEGFGDESGDGSSCGGPDLEWVNELLM